MEALSKSEMIEIDGGNPEAYELGHAIGDVFQEVITGVFLLARLFCK